MGDKMSNTLAKQLKDLRVMKGITQRQLALETGISYASIVDYENGRREPNSKAMAALERYFKVSGEFLRGEVTQHEYLKNSEEILQNFDGLIEQFKTFMNDFDTASQSNQKLSVLILIGNLQVLTDYLLHSEKSSNLNADEICKIFQAAFDLNDQGRSELAKRAAELTQLSRYRG